MAEPIRSTKLGTDIFMECSSLVELNKMVVWMKRSNRQVTFSLCFYKIENVIFLILTRFGTCLGIIND